MPDGTSLQINVAREGADDMSNNGSERAIVIDETERRETVLRALRDAGVRVVHDSGSRILVVDDARTDEELARAIPADTTLVPEGKDVARAIQRPDEADQLFASALDVRFSAAFLREKRARAPGSTDEEQLLFQASCIPEQNER
jgi:hypothetical protein